MRELHTRRRLRPRTHLGPPPVAPVRPFASRHQRILSPFGSYYERYGVPWYQHRLSDGVVVDEAEPGNYYVLGQEPSEPPPDPGPPPTSASKASKASMAVGFISTASMAASAYHGYRRNQSVGWALAWGAAGALFPVITPVIAVAQGFGKRKAGR